MFCAGAQASRKIRRAAAMFLTPAGEPVWGGTYFPKTSRYGRPAFVDVLRNPEELQDPQAPPAPRPPEPFWQFLAPTGNHVWTDNGPDRRSEVRRR